VLNSVFLHEALEAGLDAAIVHSGRILPLNHIPDRQRRVCEDLIWNRRRAEYDPLQRLVELFADAATTAAPVDRSAWSLERRLRQRIVDGDRSGLPEELDAAMDAGWAALDLVDDVLLAGMKTVGELFAAGEMQLPFVMQSAETMKAAVAHLEPHMEHAAAAGRGSIVLATVGGDVHDIGKNLVDIILSNNGYRVHNLGIKVGLAELLEAAETHGADAVGMSGLLVKSTLVMRDNLDEMQRRGIGVPVLLGGAALTRRYVEDDLRRVYRGPLFYCKDAFDGLRVMERLTGPQPAGDGFGRALEVRPSAAPGVRIEPGGPPPHRSPEVAADNPVVAPPFWGSRVIREVPLDVVAAHLDTTALFRNQWRFRPESGESDAEFKARLAPLVAERLEKAAAEGLLDPQVVYGYFPAAAEGNDLVIYEDPQRSAERTRFTFPRQPAHPYLCIADFFRPAADGETDVAAFQIVTMGSRASQRAAELFAADRYSEYLLTHGLGVQMAEALADYWHRRIRSEWGAGGEDATAPSGPSRRRSRRGRYSWGYPACPDLEDNLTVADLLGADRIGVDVGPHTQHQYRPEQTTSALICHHPQAEYFVVDTRR
jgi:5-methyltetrahydrofolate--homocysteine methyltransferase